MTAPSREPTAGDRPELSAESIAAKFNEWFPRWRWTAYMSGGYACLWAECGMRGTIGEFIVTGDATERVARGRSWRSVLIQGKRWAWRNREVVPHA